MPYSHGRGPPARRLPASTKNYLVSTHLCFERTQNKRTRHKRVFSDKSPPHPPVPSFQLRGDKRSCPPASPCKVGPHRCEQTCSGVRGAGSPTSVSGTLAVRIDHVPGAVLLILNRHLCPRPFHSLLWNLHPAPRTKTYAGLRPHGTSPRPRGEADRRGRSIFDCVFVWSTYLGPHLDGGEEEGAQSPTHPPLAA